MHSHGAAARGAVENARRQVSLLVGCRPSEVIFTSGATESNNPALGGLREHLLATGRTKILASAGEHASVLAAARGQAPPMVAGVIPLRGDGTLDMGGLAASLSADVGLVSVMAANHDIGTIHPLAAIGAICRERGVLLHSDLSQAAGKIPISTDDVDLASVSGHKLYGPGGIGALFVSRRHRAKLSPILRGGGQEGGLRAGTLPAPLCVAFGAACEIAAADMHGEMARIGKLRDELLGRLLAIPQSKVNGTMSARLPGNINISFGEVDAEALLVSLKDTISISAGSACNAAALDPSHVLLALNLPGDQARQSVRIGLGRSTTKDDVEVAARAITASVCSLRDLRRRRAA